MTAPFDDSNYHAPLSPSAAARWMQCPAAYKRECELPVGEESSPYALDGTRTHALLEQCLTRGECASTFIGRVIQYDEDSFEVDAERAERVSVALDYINGRLEKMRADAVGSHDVGLYSEDRVFPLPEYDDAVNGTADVILYSISPETKTLFLVVIDYKDGMGEVGIDDNHQLMLYYLGAVRKLIPDGTEGWAIFGEITIIQPKMDILGKPVIKTKVVEQSNLVGYARKASVAANRALDADEMTHVPGSHCQWCKVATNCRARMEYLMDDVYDLLGKNINDLADDELFNIISKAGDIKKFVDDVHGEAMRRFMEGKPVAGLKVVQKRGGNKKWSVDDEAVAKKLAIMGLPKSEIYKQSIVTPTQAAKVKWKNRKGEVKQLSDIQIERLEHSYVTFPEPSYKIVLENEKGEPVDLSPQSMFGDLVEGVPAQDNILDELFNF